MTIVVFLIGVACLVYGLIALVKPDWTWSLTEMGNSFRGQTSERSDLWGVGNAIGGVVGIVVGLGLMVFSFGAE